MIKIIDDITVFRANNPQVNSSCKGVRWNTVRPNTRIFVFDSNSRFAYAKWPRDRAADQEGILRIDLLDPSAVGCDVIGELPENSAGGFQAVVVSDRDDGLVVLDRTLGLSVLDIVQTSTTFGLYSTWNSTGGNRDASELYWDQDTRYVWLVGNGENVPRRNLFQNEAPLEIQGTQTPLKMAKTQSADRRWLVLTADNALGDLTVLDLVEGRIVGRSNAVDFRASSTLLAHPSENPFLADVYNQQL